MTKTQRPSPTSADLDQEQSPLPTDTAVTPQTDQRFSDREDDAAGGDEGDKIEGATEEVSHGLTAEAIDRGTRAWLADRLRNSPLSRHTEAWNALSNALPSLKDYIMKEVH